MAGRNGKRRRRPARPPIGRADARAIARELARVEQARRPRWDRAPRVAPRPRSGRRAPWPVRLVGLAGRLVWRYRRALAPLVGLFLVAGMAATPWGWVATGAVAVVAEVLPTRMAPARLRPPWRLSWLAGWVGLPTLWAGLGPVLGWSPWWAAGCGVIALALWTAYLRWAVDWKRAPRNNLTREVPGLRAVIPALADSTLTAAAVDGGTESVELHLRPGATAGDVVAARSAIEATLKADRGTVDVTPHDRHNGAVRISRRSVASLLAPAEWVPFSMAGAMFPAGRDALGRLVEVKAYTPTRCRHFYTIGGTGSGKGGWARLVLETLGSSGLYAQVVVDCKGGRSIPEVLSRRYAAFLPFLATEVDVARRCRLIELMDALLADRKLTHKYASWSPRRDGPFVQVWFEEISQFYTGMSATQARRAAEVILRWAREGTSLGLCLGASTQDPKYDALGPPNLSTVASTIREQMRSGVTWQGHIDTVDGRRVGSQGQQSWGTPPPGPGGANLYLKEGNQAIRTLALWCREDEDAPPTTTHWGDDLPARWPWPEGLSQADRHTLKAMAALATESDPSPDLPAARPVGVDAGPVPAPTGLDAELAALVATGGSDVGSPVRAEWIDLAVSLIGEACRPVSYTWLREAIKARGPVSHSTAKRAIQDGMATGRLVKAGGLYEVGR